MKPSSRPPRTPSRLSDSVQQHLNAYALAASAAGVGVLALAQPAEAKIVYTKTHVVIDVNNRSYNLDLTHHGATNFGLTYSYFCSFGCWFRLFAGGQTTNDREVGVWSQAAALQRGAQIGSKEQFTRSSFGSLVSLTQPGDTRGNWRNVTNRYLGLKFSLKDGTHYGWARMNVRVIHQRFITGTLTGYAYETIPNKPIIAGKTKGPDVITLEPGSLGQLAQGSAGRTGK